MMIMAQHHQKQQQPHQSDNPKQKSQQQQQQLAGLVAALQPTQQVHKPTTNNQYNQQEQQDGKRTLIKNQLYLIEQLQLENANLRNERDQLQLENEELKFQLQMISSSNILIQPNTTFKSQQLEPLIESGNNTTTKIEGNQQIKSGINGISTSSSSSVAQTSATAAISSTLTSISSTKTTQQSTQSAISNQVKILATPLRQPVIKQLYGENQQSVSNGTFEPQFAVRSSASLVSNTDGKRLIDATNNSSSSNNNNNNSDTTAVSSNQHHHINPNVFLTPASKLIGGKSTSLTEFNVKSIISAPQNRSLPHDDEEQRIILVEQRYGGDREKVQAAAIVIQRAFRKYQICKRFRTITEQLRHTCHSVSQQTPYQETPIKHKNTRENSRPSSVSEINSTTTTIAKQQNQIDTELNFASGSTRAAAWESLSSAASRLAASATAAATINLNKQNNLINNKTSQHVVSGSSSSIASSATSITTSSSSSASSNSTQVIRQSNNNLDTRQSSKQDPVVAAAINFQQLESIRKRQYRVGLNIFNKSPEKGVSFLIAHSFIDSSSPFTKNSTGGYYHSNQLHFIDKHYLVQQQQQALPTNLLTCQLCCEEDNLKRNVAHFLLHRKGLAKEKIGQYLGNLQTQFNQDVLKYYLQELEFYGIQIDLALRKFLSTFRLPGEAQKIERIVDCFSQRYVQCQQQQQSATTTTATNNSNNIVSNHNNTNQIYLHLQTKAPQQQQQQTVQQNNSTINQNQPKNNLILLSKDEIFILTFAIIMLNTDLHSPSLKPTSRMSASQFVNNLRGVFKSQNINESDLVEIYERVKANQITTTPDHVTHVMKVQQGLTVTNFQRKELPNLCVPHRRLVCFCRLFEVYDINKKERLGQHQREIFLFNDLLLVTKLARRVRANTTQLYTYRQSISLQGLYVQLFQSAHYNFGIKLSQRSNDETIIMFNARNELDQSRFVDDLGESIAEMDEMESIKVHNISETIHFKYVERLKRHAMIHNNGGPNQNENILPLQTVLVNENHQVSNKMLSMINSCDITTINKQSFKNDDNKQNDSSQNKTKTTTMTTTTTSINGESCGIKTKFNSMLNLSSSSNGDINIKGGDNISKPSKGLRLNKSFVNPSQQQQIISEQPIVSDHQQTSNGASSGSTTADAQQQQQQQRKCSTSSVYSLDSGLFLSRDVSPNQSS